MIRATPIGRAVVRRLVGPTDRRLEIHALGRIFPSPLGVGAGVDKDASWFEDLSALGFGFVEVGTITALPQEGNPRPRVVRLLRDRAILNKMGFPNSGAELAAARLSRRSSSSILGVNVGKSKSVAVEAAGDDYRACVRRLATGSDYLVLNVSSPNTPGLRELEDVGRLRLLIADVRRELHAGSANPPLFIKLDPDLDDDQLTAIVTLAVELGLDGIVAVNTTVDRGSLSDPASASRIEGGGVSGAPLRATAVEVLRRIRRLAGDRLILISVGGVASAEDVWERISAGATLVQAYTAFVYEGPGWPKRVNRELASKVDDAGLSSIQELIGADERNHGNGRDRLNGERAQVGAIDAV